MFPKKILTVAELLEILEDDVFDELQLFPLHNEENTNVENFDEDGLVTRTLLQIR